MHWKEEKQSHFSSVQVEICPVWIILVCSLTSKFRHLAVMAYRRPVDQTRVNKKKSNNIWFTISEITSIILVCGCFVWEEDGSTWGIISVRTYPILRHENAAAWYEYGIPSKTEFLWIYLIKCKSQQCATYIYSEKVKVNHNFIGKKTVIEPIGDPEESCSSQSKSGTSSFAQTNYRCQSFG